HLDIRRVEARHLRLDDERFLRLGDVHARAPLTQRREVLQLQLAQRTEEAIELLLEVSHPRPRHHGSHRVLLSPATRAPGSFAPDGSNNGAMREVLVHSHLARARGSYLRRRNDSWGVSSPVAERMEFALTSSRRSGCSGPVPRW